MTPAHSPLPWKASESKAEKDTWFVEYLDPKYDEYCPIWDEDGGTCDFDDAEFIALAVNNYEKLLSLNRELVGALEEQHNLVCDDAIGGWEGYHSYKDPCLVCPILRRAKEMNPKEATK